MAEPWSLEEAFGDPAREGSVLSYPAVQRADAARELDAEGEQLLTDWGFGAELVPRRLGGRWGSTEDLVRRLLPIFRRDPALGLGQGITSLMAAVNVWLAGSDAQQRDLAARLGAGERAAAGFHELDHGNDFLRNSCQARLEPHDGSWRVDGRKEVINNVDRAGSVLLFVRTAAEPGPTSFSLLLWEKDRTISGTADTSRRILTAGVRGCAIGQAELRGVVVPADAVVGAQGDGARVALRAFQVTRAVVPALATGTVDAALRLAVVYMRRRGLYGQTVWDLPHAKATLVRAWSTFVVADALARACVRALHLKPDQCFIASAVTKYLVPTLLNDAMHELSVLFGSSFYAVGDDFGVFEKWLRDLVVVPIGHAGSTTCLSSIVPHLPAWARRSRKGSAYEPALFRASVALGDLDLHGLGLGAGRSDSLTAPLESQTVGEALVEECPEAAELLQRWRDELEAVREIASALPPSELGSGASPRAFDTARRLSRLMAAGTLIGTWHEGRTEPSSPFFRNSRGALVALRRLSESLPPVGDGRGGLDPSAWPTNLMSEMADDIATSVDSGHTLGVEETVLPWSAPDHTRTTTT